MKRLRSSIPTLLLCAVCTVAGGYARGWLRPAPEAEVRTEIVYRDRLLAPRDTAHQAAPKQVIRYLPTPPAEMRTDTVRVPVTLTRYLACPVQPVAVGPRRVTLTAFDVEAQRWEQRSYAVPRARWGYTLSASLSDDMLSPSLQPSAALRASLRYRRVSLSATPIVTALADRTLVLRAQVGLTVTLLHR